MNLGGIILNLMMLNKVSFVIVFKILVCIYFNLIIDVNVIIISKEISEVK